MLEDAFVGLLDDHEKKTGWFVMEGFYGNFREDYYGEVDFEAVRNAKIF
jgi:hypothetical protein